MTCRTKYLLTVIFLGSAVGAFADAKQKDRPFDDATFVKMAASDGMDEVELGKIGADKAKSAIKRTGKHIHC